MSALGEDLDASDEDSASGSLMDMDEDTYAFFGSVMSDFGADQSEFQRVLRAVDSGDEDPVGEMVEEEVDMEEEEPVAGPGANWLEETPAGGAPQATFSGFSESDDDGSSFEPSPLLRFSMKRR